jgi:hypothetical protein
MSIDLASKKVLADRMPRDSRIRLNYNGQDDETQRALVLDTSLNDRITALSPSNLPSFSLIATPRFPSPSLLVLNLLDDPCLNILQTDLAKRHCLGKRKNLRICRQALASIAGQERA